MKFKIASAFILPITKREIIQTATALTSISTISIWRTGIFDIPLYLYDRDFRQSIFSTQIMIRLVAVVARGGRGPLVPAASPPLVFVLIVRPLVALEQIEGRRRAPMQRWGGPARERCAATRGVPVLHVLSGCLVPSAQCGCDMLAKYHGLHLRSHLINCSTRNSWEN